MLRYVEKTFGVDTEAAKKLVVACISSLVSTMAILLTNLAIFLFLLDIISPILNNQPVFIDGKKYVVIISALMITLVLSMTYKYNKSYTPCYMSAAKKRIKMAERLRKLPLSFFGRKDIADITTTMMKDAASLEDVFSAFIPNLFSAVVSTLLMCVFIFAYNVSLGFAIFWSVPISFALIFLTRNTQQKNGAKTKVIVLKYLDKLQECIENIKDIKSNNREEFYQGDMLNRFEKLEKVLTKTELKFGFLITGIQMILKIGMASTVIVSVNLLVNGSISTFEMFVFLMVATRVYDPLLSALVNLAGLFQAILSIERTKEFERTPIQEGKMETNYNGYDLVFDNVKFSYENDGNDREVVLDNVSFTAKQNEITALVGPSGGGKSTVLKLASRFWDLNKGTISLGGEDISKIDPETLLKSISIVFQDVILFNNTVMENIRIGKKEATDEEVIMAAKNAMCHEFIMAMPDGYQTMIGENGAKISGGERQRISIARALLKDAPVVFLDEATSSLDIQNETAVQTAIAHLTKNKTVVVIAHRMRTIMGADKIFVLKNGGIEQSGTHNELIKVNGEYQTMVKLQMDSMNWKL